MARIFGSQKIPAPTHEPQEQRVRSNSSNQARCAREEAVPICRTDGWAATNGRDDWLVNGWTSPNTTRRSQIFIAQTAREMARYADPMRRDDGDTGDDGDAQQSLISISNRSGVAQITVMERRYAPPKAMSVASCNGQKNAMPKILDGSARAADHFCGAIRMDQPQADDT